MKRFLLILFLFSLLISCQTEENKVTTPAGNDITAASVLCTLISRVSQYPTAIDNIIDGTSCFGVQLPVNVIVNGQPLTIYSAADYQTVEDIFGYSSTDTDSVSFVFPIVVIMEDFSQISINSQQQLNSVLASCPPSDGLDEIPCIDFVYPVTFNVYNPATQVPSVSVIDNDIEMFAFFEFIDYDNIININYPVTVIVNGQSIVVNSNMALESAIMDSIGTCGDDPIPVDPLDVVLTSGTWFVSYYYHNEDDTSQFSGYDFTFHANGTVTATDGNYYYPGVWDVYLDGSQQMMNIDFSDSEMGDLDDDWRLIDFTNMNVRLRQDGGGSDPDRLYFTKN